MSPPPAPSAASPLAGRSIVVTRAAAQAAPLVSALASLGAEVVRFAAIRIEAVDPAPLSEALGRIEQYDWIVFTSVNAVDHFWSGMLASGMTGDALLGASVCAIGPATARAVADRGGRVELIPEAHVGEGAAAALLAAGVTKDTRVLLPRAVEARAVLPETLRQAGAIVDDVPVYRTVSDGEGAAGVRSALDQHRIWAITFTAASTVRSFVSVVGRDFGGALTASIGPATSAALRGLGLPVDMEAAVHTVDGLVQAMRARAEGEHHAA